MNAGRTRERVAFDENTGATGSLGGTTVAWIERHRCRAQWIYQRGDEAVQAARLAGRKVYKIKVRACVATRALTPGDDSSSLSSDSATRAGGTLATSLLAAAAGLLALFVLAS